MVDDCESEPTSNIDNYAYVGSQSLVSMFTGYIFPQWTPFNVDFAVKFCPSISSMGVFEETVINSLYICRFH